MKCLGFKVLANRQLLVCSYAFLRALTIIEDEVDAGQLLKRLQSHASKEPLADWLLEAGDIGRSSNSHLILVICLNFGELFKKSRMIDGESPETCKRFGSFVVSALLDKVSRSFGQDQHATD